MGFSLYNDPNPPIYPNDHYIYIHDNAHDNGCLLYRVSDLYILSIQTIVDNVVFVDAVVVYVDIAAVVVVCYLDDTDHLFLFLYLYFRDLDQQMTYC